MRLGICVKNKPDVNIEISSKITLIYGKDSGEGKTEFISALENAKALGYLEFKSSIPVSIASTTNVEDLLFEIKTRHIIIIDESTLFSVDVIKAFIQSNHLGIFVGRSLNKGLSTSYYSIYNIRRTKNWFELSQINSLNITKLPKRANTVYVESAKDTGEHQLLTALGVRSVIPCNGNSKIFSVINKAKDNNSKFILMDLGNITNVLGTLKRIGNAEFYDYIAFEQLIVNCNQVKALGRKVI